MCVIMVMGTKQLHDDCIGIGKQCIPIPEAPLCGVSKELISAKNEC